MIVGHAALAYVAKRRYFEAPAFRVLLIASYFPDLLDKPASFFFGASGRGFGHSILCFIIALCCMQLVVSLGKMDKSVMKACALLWISHLLTDFTELNTLFWPVLGDFAARPSFDFVAVINKMYVDFGTPHQLIAEVFFVALAGWYWLNENRLLKPALGRILTAGLRPFR
jgi:hypothetical protein